MADTAVKREIDAAGSDELSQEAKRAKAGDENGGENGKQAECENVLSGFKTSSVLSDSPREKNIFIHGKVLLL